MERRRIVLISPNISQKMGGEAIKAFQFLKYLLLNGADVHVFTHERSVAELRDAFPDLPATVIPDSVAQKLLWRFSRWNDAITTIFFLQAREQVRRLAADRPDTVFHYLCPISPVLPRFPLAGVTNVLGPITGNIHYPEAFRDGEPRTAGIRRRFHVMAQKAIGGALDDKAHFARVLVSGGERTRASLIQSGCPEDVMVDVVDSGITERLLSRPIKPHGGINRRFMTSCRLVAYKGVDIAIRAVAQTRDIALDIFGDGPELARLTALVGELGVADRVSFKGWTPHDALIDRLPDYRGFVLSSLAEANGIVVQEAMSAGLPVICLRWGGPELLVDDESAILVEPTSPASVVAEIAAAMDRLASDPDLANRLATRARATAERRFSWEAAAREWIGSYPPADEGAPRP